MIEPENLPSSAEYVEAVRAQLEAYAFTKSPEGRRVMNVTAAAQSVVLPSWDRKGVTFQDAAWHVLGDGVGEDWVNAVIDALEHSMPYYVSPWVSDFLIRTSANLPDMALRPTMLPSRNGFVYFPKPLPMPPLHITTKGKQTILNDDIVALSWTHRTDIHEDVQDHQRDAAILHFYTRADASANDWRRRLGPTLSWAWHFGMKLSELAERQAGWQARVQSRKVEWDHERYDKLRKQRGRYVLALLQFLSQRILVPSHELPVPRTVAKQAQHQGWHEAPRVRVIEYRRRQYLRSGEGQRENWNGYNCWFTVGEETGGFWRRLHQPKADGTEAVWIDPFVKGDPTSKPFKPKRSSIGVIDR